MIMKLLLIAFVAAIVFWGVGRFLPRARAFFKTRLLPLILSPHRTADPETCLLAAVTADYAA